MLSRSVLLALSIGLTLTGCGLLGDPGAVPQPGECRLLTPAAVKQVGDDTRTVPCEDRHTAETFAVGTVPDRIEAEQPDDAALAAHVVDVCEQRFRRHVGGDESMVMRSTVTWSWFRPSDEAWDDGARWWRCDVVGGGEESTRLLDLPESTKGLLLGRPDDRWLACVDGPSVDAAPKIPCSRDHTWRAATTIVLGDDTAPYPGDDVVLARTRDFCSDSVGAWLGYPVSYDYAYTYFHEAEWQAGNRRSICWARTER